MTKKTMWLEISKTLNDKGYLYNAEQVSERWKTLNRAYKNVKDQNRKSGNSRKNFEFETSMDDMLGDDPAIEPLHIASSRKASTDKSSTCSSKGESQEADDSEEESNDNVEMAASKPKRPRKTTSGTVVEILQDFIEKSQKSKDDEIERKERMHREKLDAINSLVGIIKDQKQK